MPQFFLCFHFSDKCEYFLSFLYMNLFDFCDNFWLLLSCIVRLKSPFDTCYYHLSHVPLPFVVECSYGAQVSRTSFIPLFSGLWLSAVSIWIWRHKLSPLFQQWPALFSLQFSVPYLCTWALQLVLMGSFCGKAPVQLLCCCHWCPQKAFFPELSHMLDFNSPSPDVLACVHNPRVLSIV